MNTAPPIEPTPFFDVTPTVTEFYFGHITKEDREHALGPRNWPTPCPWCSGRIIHSEACRELRIGWIPRFTFGKHKGRRADEVPRDYLEWIWQSGRIADVDLRAAVAELLGKTKPTEQTEASEAA